jgi:hypothetical protein
MTDEIDSFAEACTKADAAAANADKSNSGPTPELTNEVVINLAGLTPLQYAQQLAREAKKYKTPVKLLEKAVEAAKIEQEAEKLIRSTLPSCSRRLRRGSCSMLRCPSIWPS